MKNFFRRKSSVKPAETKNDDLFSVSLSNLQITDKPPEYGIDPTEKFDQLSASLSDYEILRLAGKGGFAKVYQIRRKADGKIFALKVMKKEVLRKMKQFLTEDHARYYATEIYMGLNFLHSKGIVYRDLKPENVLFDANGHAKLADLGFAKELNGNATTTFCGTPSYLAPEVLNRQPYGLKIDWWTFGVIIFQLCSGCSPFQEPVPQKTFARILQCNIRWPPDPQQYFSNTVFDLIMRLFELDPEERLGDEEIKNHTWFSKVDFEAMANHRIPPPGKVHSHVKNYSQAMENSEELGPETNMELSRGNPITQSTEQMFRDF
ncbi:camp-dependent protein kinase catalytic subunit [Boothiomyces macroporosus]|uniref:cAMP-dependent protein kinase n=1 Tax=Boothiomyces macroporosus TaxID=261099 RepID=A0AAD5Y218_9FUNG|nr:camp-dependent protein kinase catalytic subunit [Boothiomyces macroporosus]